MTKLEECARALSASESGDPDYYDKADLITRGALKRDVRAVLMALRESDASMVNAGMLCADVSLAAEFTAMIDAVLDNKA